MLEPDQRLLLTQAFRAPQGYKVDFALATTYSLDPGTLFGATLHLSLLGNELGMPDVQNGLVLLKGLRRCTERLVVFCQSSQIYVPKIPHVLYGLLERSVIPVAAPLGGAFHPKLWALRFLREGEKPILRVVVLSRNLTNDRSWDVGLAIEGIATGRHQRRNEGLRRLVEKLPDLSPHTPSLTRDKVLALAEELHSTEWQLPDNFEDLWFSSIGFSGRGWVPPHSQKLAVISPFLSIQALQQLAKTTGESVLLVSRPEELDRVGAAQGIFPRCLALSETAEVEDGEDPSQDANCLQGLHAKVYISQTGWDTAITMGSANATTSALVSGKNVELIVTLTGKTSRVGSIEKIFAQEGLGKVLEAWKPGEPELQDQAILLAEQRLKEAKAELAESGLRVHCEGEGDCWQLELRPMTPIRLAGIERVVAWPISQQTDNAVDVIELRPGCDVKLSPCSLAAVTGFIAFEMTASPAPSPCRFVLNLPVDNLPEARRAAIVRLIVNNQEGFLKYLLFLLADVDEDGLPNEVLLALNGTDGGYGNSLESALPLLEEMTRALSRDPARLDSIQSLIDDLVQTEEGRQMVDGRFLEMWKVYSSVLSEVRK